jgi:hypothetical protein
LFKVMNSSPVDWPLDSLITNDCKEMVVECSDKFVLKKRQIANLKMSFRIPELCGDQTLKLTFFFTSRIR